MQFSVTERFVRRPYKKNHFYLTWDEWDDFDYRTLYGLKYVDHQGVIYDLSGVRIAYFGIDFRKHPLTRGEVFSKLDNSFFSLGTSDEYYEALNNLGDELREFVLNALNDVARYPDIFDKAIEDPVTYTSLMRNITRATVTGQYRRMSEGGARLTPYDFTFRTDSSVVSEGYELSFTVIPESMPPTNIHVLIGKNGVGKTRLLNQMVDSLIDVKNGIVSGYFADTSTGYFDLFANLVFVSFSAFDEARSRKEQKDKTKAMLYHYIGLRHPNQTKGLKDDGILREEFLKSLNNCKASPYKERWINSISQMEVDPNFKELDVLKLIHIEAENLEYQKRGREIFEKLSSGHKVVLLSLTRIIETLQEKTLIIIDEPEAHLHPPLLAMFTRTLSDLLIRTNGVCIIATHSPVVLQEVPQSCVWKLRRSGTETVVDRITIESFGENVGRLTNEIFGLEVTVSGYYKMLSELVDRGATYKKILRTFDGQLGMEAKAVVMALINQRDAE